MEVAGILMLGAFFITVLAAVAMRYLTLPGLLVLADLQHYLISAMIYLAIILAFAKGKHVKLQILPADNGFLGGTGFYMAWMLIAVVIPLLTITWVAIPQLVPSWHSMEGSRELAGLPGYFVIKTLLPVFCLVMAGLALRKIRQHHGKHR